MHVCMYVCMYACVRVHVCMYACVHVCMYACMYALWPYGSGCCCHDVLTPSRPCAVCHDDGCWVCSSEHGLVGISCSYIRSRLSSGRLHAACHRNPCCHLRCERAPVKDFCASLCAFSAAQVAPPSPCRAGRPWARRILTRALLVPSSSPCAPSGRPCTGSWFLWGRVQFSLGKGPFSLDTCISDVSYHVSKPLAPNTFRIHARYVSRHDTLQDTLEYVHSERFGTPKFGIHCDTVGYVRDT